MNGKPDFIYDDSEEDDREAFLETVPSTAVKSVAKPVPLAKPVEPLAKPVPLAKPAPLAKSVAPVAKSQMQPVANPFEEFQPRQEPDVEVQEWEEPAEMPQEEIEESEQPQEIPPNRLAEAPKGSSSSALAQTIEIPSSAFSAIFPHIEPVPHTSKFHHFRLRHQRDRTRFQSALATVDPAITMEWNDSAQGNVDVTLSSHGALVGKIQFLHFDRRDQGNRAKYYVKLYFYQFQSTEMFRKVMEAAKDFFMNLGPHGRKASVHVARKSLRKRAPRATRRRAPRAPRAPRAARGTRRPVRRARTLRKRRPSTKI